MEATVVACCRAHKNIDVGCDVNEFGGNVGSTMNRGCICSYVGSASRKPQPQPQKWETLYTYSVRGWLLSRTMNISRSPPVGILKDRLRYGHSVRFAVLNLWSSFSSAPVNVSSCLIA